MRIAIVGGNGTLGRPVTAELARGGHEVRVLSRSGEYRVDLTTGAVTCRVKKVYRIQIRFTGSEIRRG